MGKEGRRQRGFGAKSFTINSLPGKELNFDNPFWWRSKHTGDTYSQLWGGGLDKIGKDRCKVLEQKRLRRNQIGVNPIRYRMGAQRAPSTLVR